VARTQTCYRCNNRFSKNQETRRKVVNEHYRWVTLCPQCVAAVIGEKQNKRSAIVRTIITALLIIIIVGGIALIGSGSHT
jgi:hypothetical protein